MFRLPDRLPSSVSLTRRVGMRRTIPAVAISLLALAACARETPLAPSVAAPSFAAAPAIGNGGKDVLVLVDEPFDVQCATETLHGTINGFVQVREFTRDGTRNVTV